MPRVIDDSTGGIGASMTAYLTEVQFQAQYGPGWILQDGRSVAGSRYATLFGASLAPDARGRVIRGKDNAAGVNPDGDLALGAAQTDSFGSHAHGGATGSHSHPTQSYVAQAGTAITTFANGGNNLLVNSGTNGATASISADGGNETRMKNVTANHFIRIN